MLDWLIGLARRAFDSIAEGTGHAVAEARHELVGGWFGRNFEPHPTHQHSDPGWTLADHDKGHAPDPQAHQPTEPDREHGIDR